MADDYGKWYEEFKDLADIFGEDELYEAVVKLVESSKNSFAMNRRIMAKAIDVSWVEAIENGLVHLDNVLRNPRKTIEDVEEIVPIALSRKITVDSVRHLAQHTDLIQSIDKKTGKITPSKILNIHKEESLMTYENKFVNTLVDRLFIFVNRRYEKLAVVPRDELVHSIGYETFIEQGSRGRLKMSVNIETVDGIEAYNENGYTVWQRVEKLKKAIEGYKGSELCMALGNTYVRPPIMRTNAIMKNVDLKACLTLWQYIESYDKVGYSINVEETVLRPQEQYMKDMYRLAVLELLLFRTYTTSDTSYTELKSQKSKPTSPKIIKKFEKELSPDYDVTVDAVAGYISADGNFQLEKRLPTDIKGVLGEINQVIEIEKAYLEEKELERLERIRAEEEEERRQEEIARVEAARQEELRRIERQREEEERQRQELIAQKRAEIEAQERERERLEQERLARLEEIRKREEEEARRREEERLRREEEERIAAERERISQNRQKMRSELGEAEGVAPIEEQSEEELERQAYADVTEAEIEEAIAEIEENAAEGEEESEFEDPRAVAARHRLEQQRKEKERIEKERAERLKAEREYFQNKPFEDIRKEYSKNPIHLIPRIIRWILAMVFGIIPRDTDNPAFKQKRKEIVQKKRQKEQELQKKNEMEVYYRKYAKTFKYSFIRSIDDYKFKKKKRKQLKNKPKPVYTPPNRTPEQQLEINNEMKRLYREYHVTIREKLTRRMDEMNIRRREAKRERDHEKQVAEKRKAEKAQKKAAEQKKLVRKNDEDFEQKSKFSKAFNIAATVILVLCVGIMVIILVRSAQGKPTAVFGKTLLKVVTGSMEPSIHVGDYIKVEETDPSQLNEGDIITFYSADEGIEGLLVTHRIAEVKSDGSFVTRGDANPVSDSTTVTADRILGRYTGKDRFFMWIESFADAKKLLLLVAVIPIFIISLLEVRSLLVIGKEISEQKIENAEEQKQKMIREAIEKEKQRLAEENYQQQDSEVVTDESGKPDEEAND